MGEATISPADAVTLLPNSIMDSLEEQGLAIVTLDDPRVGGRDSTATGTRASSLTRGSHAEEEAGKVLMEVALRCEFVQPQQLLAGHATIRSSSFQLPTKA